jgi:choline dehydrogenase-like flavoprotein
MKVELNALVTSVILDHENRAIGVNYLKGERLYRAHGNQSTEPGEQRQAFASRETILSGGAFNSPQLLMLSGIGPRCELERHGIKVRVDLPGVGTNLQDRYEVSVVNRMKDDWEALRGAKFRKGKPVSTVGDGEEGSLPHEWGRACGHQEVETESAAARPFLYRTTGAVRGLFPRLFEIYRTASELPELGHLEGPYLQHGWNGYAEIRRSS